MLMSIFRKLLDMKLFFNWEELPELVLEYQNKQAERLC